MKKVGKIVARINRTEWDTQEEENNFLLIPIHLEPAKTWANSKHKPET